MQETDKSRIPYEVRFPRNHSTYGTGYLEINAPGSETAPQAYVGIVSPLPLYMQQPQLAGLGIPWRLLQGRNGWQRNCTCYRAITVARRQSVLMLFNHQRSIKAYSNDYRDTLGLHQELDSDFTLPWISAASTNMMKAPSGFTLAGRQPITAYCGDSYACVVLYDDCDQRSSQAGCRGGSTEHTSDQDCIRLLLISIHYWPRQFSSTRTILFDQDVNRDIR